MKIKELEINRQEYMVIKTKENENHLQLSSPFGELLYEFSKIRQFDLKSDISILFHKKISKNITRPEDIEYFLDETMVLKLMG